MDEMELTALLKAEGWTVHRRNKQSRHHQVYIYAARREGSKIREVYIAPQHKLGELTAEDIKNRLQHKK